MPAIGIDTFCNIISLGPAYALEKDGGWTSIHLLKMV